MTPKEIQKMIEQAYINALTNTLKILMREEERRALNGDKPQ